MGPDLTHDLPAILQTQCYRRVPRIAAALQANPLHELAHIRCMYPFVVERLDIDMSVQNRGCGGVLQTELCPVSLVWVGVVERAGIHYDLLDVVGPYGVFTEKLQYS